MTELAQPLLEHLRAELREPGLGAPIGESGLNPLDASVFGERLAARFARITGVTPSLPAVPR